MTLSKSILFPIFLSVTLLVGPGAFAAPGDIYAGQEGTDTTDGNIIVFAPTGARTSFPATGVNYPLGSAFSPTGELFVAGGSVIVAFTTSGESRTFATGLDAASGIAFDGAGNLYVSEQISKKILKFTPAGVKTTFGTVTGFPAELAFDSKGNLFAASNQGPGTIFEFTPDGVRTVFSSSVNDPYGLAFDTLGNLFVGDRSGGTISKVTPDGVVSHFADVGQPFAIAFDAVGNLFVASALDATIRKISPTGVQKTFAKVQNGAVSLAIEPVLNKLRNLSTRGSVQLGDGALIGGFITGGNTLRSNAVLIRALGPSLTGAGVTGALADPTLEIHDASGTIIASNNDWQDTQAAQITATGLAPKNAKESAICAVLPAGAFTAVVQGNAGTTGIALVEIYALEQ